MNAKLALWAVRLGLPAVGYGIATYCGQTPRGALDTLGVAAIDVIFLAVIPIIGLAFYPILTLYGIKNSKDSPDVDVRDPDTQLFLLFSIPLTLVVIYCIADRAPH